jgi:hypothetical protein
MGLAVLCDLCKPAEGRRVEVRPLLLDCLDDADELQAVAFVDPAAARVERVAQDVAEFLSRGASLDETVADLFDVHVPEIDRLSAEGQRHDLNFHARRRYARLGHPATEDGATLGGPRPSR